MSDRANQPGVVRDAPPGEAALAATMVENLVTQFRSALDFYRELVQNSIDAGSPRVDVWMEFLPHGAEPAGEDPLGAASTGPVVGGTIAIHVDDFGDGMTEAIIDSELTQLFASSKDDDLTKIGKFGIGFVSVFALRPRAVLVHTGRVGEYWEVFFGEDRSFVKARLDRPVEGTQVTLFVEGGHQRYVDLVRRSVETLRSWCIHSETEVTFEDRSSELRGEPRRRIVINEPFAVTGRCAVRHEEPGTTIVAAYDDDPEWGFYNRGLALLRTRAFQAAWEPGLGAELGGVTTKIKSRYLEHTLTRETVLRDENYEKAVARVLEVVRGPLRQALVAELSELASTSLHTADRLGRYASGLRIVASWPLAGLREISAAPIIATVHGPPVSLDDIARAAWEHGRVYLAEHASDATAAARQLGGLVVLGYKQSPYGDVGLLAPDGHPLLSPVAVLLERWMEDAESRMANWRGWAAVGRELVEYAEALARAAVNADMSPLDAAAWRRRRVRAMFARPDDLLVGVEEARDLPDNANAMVTLAADALREVGAGYKDVVAGRIAAADAPLFAVGHAARSRMLRPPERALVRSRRPLVVVNAGHPHFAHQLAVYEASPALAVYCLSRALLLDEDRRLDLDVELMAAAARLVSEAGAVPRAGVEPRGEG